VRGRLFPIDSDWCEWRQDPPLPGTVLVRVAADPGGRLVLTGLRIDGAPSAELLRSIPVGRIEAAANAQLTIVGDAVTAVPPARRPGHRRRAPNPDGRGWETSDPSRAAIRPATQPVQRGIAGVAAVTGRGRPDSFYQEVAHTYLDLAQASIRPVAELAEANGVPVTTAHRWIKEARRRRFLPPGRPGTAG
jgi:hypothetical protein